MGENSNASPEAAFHGYDKKHLKRWGALAALLIIMVGGVTVGVAAKLSGDMVAEETLGVLKQYVSDVVLASQKSDDPEGIVSAINAVDVPEFKKVPLGDISSDYKAARTLHEKTVAKVKSFTDTLNGYAQTLEFYDNYTEQKATLSTHEASNPTPNGRTRDIPYLEKSYELLQDMNDLIEKAKVSSEYSDEFVELGRVYSSMELNMEAISFSLKQGNDIAYTNVYDMYMTASAQLPRVENDLGSFAKEIPAKVTSARNDLKKYGDGL